MNMRSNPNSVLPEPSAWLVDGQLVITDQWGTILHAPLTWPERSLDDLRVKYGSQYDSLVRPLVFSPKPNTVQ